MKTGWNKPDLSKGATPLTQTKVEVTVTKSKTNTKLASGTKVEMHTAKTNAVTAKLDQTCEAKDEKITDLNTDLKTGVSKPDLSKAGNPITTNKFPGESVYQV